MQCHECICGQVNSNSAEKGFSPNFSYFRRPAVQRDDFVDTLRWIETTGGERGGMEKTNQKGLRHHHGTVVLLAGKSSQSQIHRKRESGHPWTRTAVADYFCSGRRTRGHVLSSVGGKYQSWAAPKVQLSRVTHVRLRVLLHVFSPRIQSTFARQKCLHAVLCRPPPN